jgi:hypothetical protein
MANSNKGSPIKIIGGAHKGCTGWLDKSRETTDCYTPVIVRHRSKEKVTKCKHENYVLVTEVKDPVNYEEAMMQQHPDMEDLLNQLVRKMAECEMVQADGESAANLCKIFRVHLAKAVQRQNSKGNKARWCRVRWSSHS